MLPNFNRQFNGPCFPVFFFYTDSERQGQLLETFHGNDGTRIGFSINVVNSGYSYINLPLILKPSTPEPVEHFARMIFYRVKEIIRRRMFECPLMHIISERAVETLFA